MSSRDLRRQTRRKKGEEREPQTRASRRPLLYAFSVVILVLIVISFVGVPMISQMGGRGRLTFGYYDGEPIEYIPGNYMASQYELIAERIRATDQSGNLESQLYQAYRYAFNQTVLHTAILLRMEESGAHVSDERVSDTLVEYGPYVTGGSFDRSRYQATPQAERVRIRRLRREELLHDQYLADLFSTEKMSDAEKQFIAEMASPERRFAFVSFEFSELPDSRVLDFGLGNRQLFQRRRLSRITITSSRREAEQVRDLAFRGESSFDELARSYSRGFYADKGGNMDWQNYYDVRVFFDSEEPVEQIFALQEGEISELYESGGSWVFYRADSEVVQPDFEQEETLQLVRDYILANEVGVAEEYFLQQATELAATAREQGFDQAVVAARAGPIFETEWLPVNYGNIFPSKRLRLRGAEQNPIAGASRNEQLYRAAFSLDVGGVSEPLLIGNTVLLLNVVSERETPEEDLEVVQESTDRLALQVLQSDLPAYLIDEDKLVDDFQTTFFNALEEMRRTQ